MDWSVAQAVECLLCKHKALNSNANPTKEEKEKNQHCREANIRSK
jgi:hypothetical protein